VAYTPAVAAALSGASLGQLSYWRRGPRPIVPPVQTRVRGRVFYSYQDVVALRTTVYLRGRKVSLQRIRRAVQQLRQMGEGGHLSSYRLVASGKDVLWVESAKDVVALTGRPGQRVIAEMVDILDEFEDSAGNRVSSLSRPAPGVEVDREVRSGFPVIEGTRVPYDLVASLLADGMDPEHISEIYPAVSPDSARGALTFAGTVDARRQARAA
jgi:uncharacterized protein (DUF433 family)